MTALNTNPAGYQHSICVSCTNGQQTVTLDNWIHKQIKDCTSSLTVGTQANTALDYSGDPLLVSVGPASWETFFQNTETIDCPILSCSISDAGSCGSGVFSGSTDVTFDTVSPWLLTASVLNPDGYSHSVCVSCENGKMTVDLDNWVISQSHRCKVVFPVLELSYFDISLPYNPSLGS